MPSHDAGILPVRLHGHHSKLPLHCHLFLCDAGAVFHLSEYAGAEGLDPNLALFAAGFLLYAVFNAVFLPSFYANGYKVGVAFVKAIIPTTLVMIVFEALPHVPGLMWLDDMDAATQVRLLPYFVAAVLLYGIGTVLTFRRAAAQYEKVDL